jgi:hypothetical protein
VAKLMKIERCQLSSYSNVKILNSFGCVLYHGLRLNISLGLIFRYVDDSRTKKTEPPRQMQCMIFAIVSAGGGLLVGIVSASIVCLLVNKRKSNMRYVKKKNCLYNSTSKSFQFYR